VSPLVPTRAEVSALEGYHSPQVDADVRLNTNESPFPPPPAWREELVSAVSGTAFHRYPDREATALRRALADFHGVTAAEIYCANGSNEVLQNLLRAYGGPGRRALVFEPTYQLHAHISRYTLTEVVKAGRGPDLRIDLPEAVAAMERNRPEITFVCSPNNPTGRSEEPTTIAELVTAAPGLVVVDEAYGQFSPWSALELRPPAPASADDVRRGLVVVRTFSKTWAMAGIRLGYLVADPEVVEACQAVTLPYHLSAVAQEAGLLALRYRAEMDGRVALVTEERGRLAAALADLPVDSWPSDANFILFRPQRRDGKDVWADLLDHGILIRDCSSWEGLPGCLRVTVGTPEENDRFIEAVKECV
jgi:histidinol-phosphate aminotransferase